MIKHIRRWNIWRKRNVNSRLHKFLVLIGFVKSPTMCTVILPEEEKEILDRIYRFNRGISDKASVRIVNWNNWNDCVRKVEEEND